LGESVTALRSLLPITHIRRLTDEQVTEEVVKLLAEHIDGE
jgi:hypothetical protein